MQFSNFENYNGMHQIILFFLTRAVLVCLLLQYVLRENHNYLTFIDQSTVQELCIVPKLKR
jgi:hypothetical protein